MRLALQRLPQCMQVLLAGTMPLLGAPVHAHDNDVHAAPEVAAVQAVERIELDGRFDEEVWTRAPLATGFRQRNPREGEPTSEYTAFQVAYDEVALYFAIHAHDSEPSAIVAREMQRDAPLFRDDAITLLIDASHDHRNTYSFQFNANGAQEDALVTDEGVDVNDEWDGIWTVVTRRTDSGWTAEVAIPFSTLRFDPDLDRWGFNMRRIIRRRSEFSFWSFMALDAFVYRVSRYGHLTGIVAPDPGLNLQLKPFVTGTASAAENRATSSEADVGLDVKWGLTRNLALDLTYNTDFAETETDSFQINLTRFSLFFPEKREFFLENAGIFRFGPGAPDLDLFFSRRIGIGPGGQEVPVEWGSRLTGRIGDWNVGLLTASTEGASAAEGEAAETDWSVARLQRNLGTRSNLGVMVTQDSPAGSGDGRSYGIDTLLRPTRRLSVSAFAAGTDNPESVGQQWAAGGMVGWSGSIWFGQLESFEIGDAFDPRIGFVRRRGVRRHRGAINYQPRPAARSIRDLRFSLRGDLVNRLDDSLESSQIEIQPFGIEFESGDELRLFARLESEDLTAPFEIRPGVVIPPGRYDFESAGFVLETGSKRAASGELEVSRGGFFNGDRLRSDLMLRLRPSRHLSSETTWSRNEIDLPDGRFTTQLFQERLAVAFTPDISLNTLVQYNDAEELAAVNLRFNWIYRPGADLFLVVNQSWNAPSLGDLTSRDRQVILKFTYLIAR